MKCWRVTAIYWRGVTIMAMGIFFRLIMITVLGRRFRRIIPRKLSRERG